ncbi:MAG: TIGR02530 family flagellar biosynthesis protein [Caldicoprobacter oshimai]|uniref:Flagellar operon protein n=1 Tax=Caldicoprobacter faecalis TaxID=937334 RepID=A0A1I5RMM0_9FIRM|nr:TIGR02530 family flagellar biosynthesis protein [Caldicoprobacter faecalis]SFP59501.1 flagellar operon protein [Caldicoprobacter faecalis]
MDSGKVEYTRIIYSGKVSGIPYVHSPQKVDKTGGDVGFDEILKEAIQKEQSLKFSKHAQTRMKQRNIWLSHAEIDKISKAVEKAQEKGVRDSLVLMGNLAFIVNVPTRTVVTAVDGESIKENIFTNIDGAVVL